jgi:hypothetical protein
MNTALEHLLNHLEVNKDSPSISLAYASIGDDGCVEIARFLRDNIFVKTLDLRGNNVQGKGATALAGGIKLNRSLRSLNLKWNAIGKDVTGVQALGDVLKANATITHLDLRNNRINSQGIIYLAEVLRENNTITHMDLSWNELGVDGGLTLLDALKHNTSLIECQLSGTKVGESTLHEVAFVLRRNRSSVAYKAQPGHAAPEAPAKSVVSSTLGMATMAGSRPPAEGLRGFAAERGATGTMPGKKDESNLMLRLMMKEREQVTPDDKLFFQDLSEYIDRLQVEVTKNKQGRIDAEERERVATSGFVDREARYSKEIRGLEEQLQKNLGDKENLQKETHLQTGELRRLHDENALSTREAVAVQEHAQAQDESLRAELRDLMVEKRRLQDALAEERRNVVMREQENHRLSSHVKGFQREVNEALVG